MRHQLCTTRWSMSEDLTCFFGMTWFDAAVD